MSADERYIHKITERAFSTPGYEDAALEVVTIHKTSRRAGHLAAEALELAITQNLPLNVALGKRLKAR